MNLRAEYPLELDVSSTDRQLTLNDAAVPFMAKLTGTGLTYTWTAQKPTGGDSTKTGSDAYESSGKTGLAGKSGVTDSDGCSYPGCSTGSYWFEATDHPNFWYAPVSWTVTGTLRKNSPHSERVTSPARRHWIITATTSPMTRTCVPSTRWNCTRRPRAGN